MCTMVNAAGTGHALVCRRRQPQGAAHARAQMQPTTPQHVSLTTPRTRPRLALAQLAIVTRAEIVGREIVGREIVGREIVGRDGRAHGQGQPP
jgi:hypothetical protein